MVTPVELFDLEGLETTLVAAIGLTRCEGELPSESKCHKVGAKLAGPLRPPILGHTNFVETEGQGVVLTTVCAVKSAGPASKGRTKPFTFTWSSTAMPVKVSVPVSIS
jgi:hypothetical protein